MAGPRLKILITDPHLRGGGQVRYVATLGAELATRGHRVIVGCRPDSVLVDEARQAGCIAHNRFAYRGGLRPLAWWRDIRETMRLLREQKPDIVHVNGSQDHWTCAVANRLLGRPACVIRTRHNTYKVANNLPNRLLNRRWTDFQIVVCDVVRKDLMRSTVFDGERMITIHNGVDADAYRANPEARAAARAEFGYADDEIVCGIAARLVPAKGHEFLFKAAAQLRQSFPQMRLLILGQGVLESQLRALAETLKISDIVHFAGFRNDMPHCTQAFDIGVLPSIDCDTSSFSIKEEMAAEKPIVASDYGGLKEIVNDGLEGFITPAGEVTPLAAALRRMLAAAPEVRARMGLAGRQRVLRDFTAQVFAQRTEAAYYKALELIRGRTAPR